MPSPYDVYGYYHTRPAYPLAASANALGSLLRLTTVTLRHGARMARNLVEETLWLGDQTWADAPCPCHAGYCSAGGVCHSYHIEYEPPCYGCGR